VYSPPLSDESSDVAKASKPTIQTAIRIG
jgi:hypothetical protein